MPVVKGKNAITYIYHNGVWKLQACARNCSLDVVTETIEITVSGSGKYRSFIPTVNSWSGTLEGVVFLNETGMLTLPDLRQLQLAHVRQRLRYQRTDEASNVYTDEGYFYITGTSDSAGYNDLNTFTLAIIGDGTLTQIFTSTLTTSGRVNTYTYTAAGGESSFIEAALIGKDIVGVFKDGPAFTSGSGTPIGKEYVYDPAGGEFLFGVPLEPGEKVFVQYQDL